MDRFGITADQLMEVKGLTAAHVATMHMTLEDLRSAGFTMEHLMAMGLDAATMRQFGHTLQQWKQAFDCDWKKLAFTDYTQAERLGWSRQEQFEAGVHETPAAVASANTTRGPRALEF